MLYLKSSGNLDQLYLRNVVNKVKGMTPSELQLLIILYCLVSALTLLDFWIKVKHQTHPGTSQKQHVKNTFYKVIGHCLVCLK